MNCPQFGGKPGGQLFARIVAFPVKVLRDVRKRRLVGGMARSPKELRELSLQLLAHSNELRHTAEAARRQGVHFREAAKEVRTHGETCRSHADAGYKRQDAR
jgi:hypothetical protein